MKHFNLLKQLLLIPLLVLAAGLTAIAQPLNGVYTIGGTSPNYATLAAAVADLNTKGVSGQVWFNIRTGTYGSTTNWVADISGSYAGASTHRVTFQSESGNMADVTISNSNTSGVNYIFRSSGAGNITLRNMTLASTSSSNTNLIQIAGAASNDSFYNMSLSSPVASSSASGATALIYGYFYTGSNNVIYNNTFTNGYYGVYLYGSSSTPASGTVIANNTFTGQYGYGAYLWYNNNLKFLSNTITKTSNTTTYYGAYLYNCKDALKVLGNTMTLTGTSSTHYGIYGESNTGSSSSAALRPAYKNNNITISMTSGSAYGMMFQYYNSYDTVSANTISITKSSSGSAYPFYNMYYNANRYIVNNSFTTNAATSSSYIYTAYYCDNNIFNNNTINFTSTSGSQYPFYYSGYGSYNCQFNNNTVTGTATTSGTIYGFSDCGSYGGNTTISGNTMSFSQTTSGAKYGFSWCFTGASNNIVTNNTMNFAGGTGAAYGYNYSFYSGSNNNTITGNTISMVSGSTTYGMNYSLYSSSSNNNFSNNTVDITNNSSTTLYGLYQVLSSSCNNNNFNNNTISVKKATATLSGSVYMGYYFVYSSSSNNNVNGNTFIAEAGNGYNYGFGYYIYSYCNNTQFKNNNVTFKINGTSTFNYLYSHGSYMQTHYYSNDITETGNTFNFTSNSPSGWVYGYYYAGYYSNNWNFSNNTYNINQAATTGTAGVYGMMPYAYGSTGWKFNNNKITATGKSTGSLYPMYLYYPTNMEIKNNTVNAVGNGTSYAVSSYYGTNANFTNNTFNTNSTNANSCAAYIYAYPQTPAFSSYWYNNIFSNSMTSGVPVQIPYWEAGVTLDMNYNNYYCKSTSAAWPTHRVLYNWTTGGVPGPGSRNLHQMRTVAGTDKGSIAYNPGYIDSSSDLRPNPARQESWSVNGRGLQITGNNTDILGNARVTTKAAGVPDLGAYEFTPTTIAPLATASATPALGTTTYYIFGQDTVMTTAWPASGSIPTDLEVREYSGVAAPGVTALGPTFMYYYVDAQPVGGTAPFSTNSTIYYTDPATGTTAETALRMAQKDGSSAWVAHPHTSSGASATLDRIFKTGLTNFGLLTGSDIANNAGALDIVTPTPRFCAGTYTLSAKIANLGNNTINTVKVSYQVDGGSISTVTYTTPILSSAASSNTTATVTLGSITFTNKAKWIKIWTSDPNNVVDPVPSDDTILLRWGPGLSGEYTVGGTAPDYATPVDAAADLKKFGVCGPVWFNIRPGTYTGRLTLEPASGMSTANRVTFRAENGVASSVTLSNTSDVVKFNQNASFFTLNNLSLTMTGSGNTVDMGGGAVKDSINGCVISAPAANTSAYPLRVYQPSPSVDSLAVTNNTLSGGYYGMYLYGYNGSAAYDGIKNSLFADNVIQNQNGMSVYMMYTKDVRMMNNYATSTYQPSYGMYIYYSRGCRVTGNKIVYPNTYQYLYGAIYYYNFANNASEGMTIANNVISLAGSATFTGYGIYANYGDYNNIYNNSIAIDMTGTGPGMYFSSMPANTNVYNNAVAHFGGGPAMYFASTPGSTMNLDYNNYYTTGAQLIAGVSADTLTRWRLMSGKDLNSISYNPGFLSNINPTPDASNPASWSLNGRGIHITGNNKDIAGNARVVNRQDGVPDIGAYEFTPQTIPPVAKAIPATVAAGATQVFTFGQDTVAKIKWDKDTYVPSTVTIRQWTGTVPPQFPDTAYMYFYTDIDAVPVTYINDMDIYYKDPWTGKIPSTQETNIRMIRKEAPTRPWSAYNGTSSSTSTARNLMVAPTITGLGYFTGIRNGAIFSANIKPLAPVVFCPGGSVTLQSGFTSTGYTHQWLNNGIAIPGANAPSYTAVMSGDYSVSVADIATSNSVTSNAVAITIVSAPAAVATANGPTTICTGNNVTLNVGTGSGLSYQWMNGGIDIPGATNPSYLVTNGGRFAVKVKNIGCTNISNDVVVIQGPVSVNLGNDTSFCTAHPLHLDALNPGAKYLWSDGSTSQTITISSYGKHKIAVHVDAGVNCIAKDTIEVEISPMPEVVGISSIRQFGNTYKFEPAGSKYVESYLWIFGDGSTDTTSSILHEYKEGDIFELKLVVFNGCGSDTTLLKLPLTVQDLTSRSEFELYPNPAKSNVTLKVYGEAQFNDVVIVNSIGQIVMRQPGTNTKSRTFDIRMLPDGHYFIRANTVDGKVISKPFQIVR